MFFVFNKQKILTYTISIVTVVLLFCIAGTLTQNTSNNTVETSSSTSKLLPIYKVQTNENEVAFTMNCAW